MQLANLQQLWTLLLPLIAFAISYIIQQEHWTPQLNGLIALIAVLVATGASLLLQGDNITDASVVAALSTALQSEALAPLTQYLRGATSGKPPAQPQAQPVRFTTQPMPAVTPPPPPSQPSQ